MKKFMISLILVTFGIIFPIGLMAQAPPLPPSDQGTSGNQSPGSPAAPIGPGTSILLLLAAGYGISKFYDLRKKSVFSVTHNA